MKTFMVPLFHILAVLIMMKPNNPAYGQTISSDAEWPCFRRDLFNTGISPLQGPITELQEKWRYPLGGGLGYARMHDVDGDSLDEIFAINAGKIIAYHANGALMWNSPILGINYILAILDLDADGNTDLICARSEPPSLFILSAASGQVMWQHDFPPPAGSIHPGGVQIADLDRSNDGKLEIFCWPWSGTSTGYAFQFDDGLASGHLIWQVDAEITWSYIPQVMVADMDCDSIPEVVIATYGHIYGWQGDNGTQKIDFEFTTGGSYGRNYGIISLTDIDNDPYPEVAVLAHSLNEHITLIDNLGPTADMIELSMLWDHWYEYSYPEDHKALRVSPNSVNDLDGDGQVEVVCSLFDDSADARWHLIIYQALTGEVEFDGPDYYLLDVQNLDGNGVPEIIVSQQTAQAPSINNFHILRGQNNAYSAVTSLNASPILEAQPDLPPKVNSTSGNDVLFLRDLDFDGRPNIFTVEGSSLTCYEFKNQSLSQVWQSTAFTFSPRLLDAGKTDVEDFRSPFISIIDGHSYVLDSHGAPMTDIAIGSYYAMPIAADLQGDGAIEIFIQNALGHMNVLDVESATAATSPQAKWHVAAHGKSAKYGRNSTAYVDDLEGDGLKEVLLASGNKLLIYDYAGNIKREYEFESYPYEWVTGFFSEDSIKDLFVAFNAAGGHTNIIHIYDGNGNPSPLWTKDYGPYSGYVVIYDFTSDGIDDIILREHYDLITLDGKNGKRWGFEPGAYYHTPILMDTDFDGLLEVINGAGYLEVSVNRMYGKGHVLGQIWEQPTGYLDCYARMPGTADVDNDGHVEVGVSSTNGTFTCYDARSGVIEWSYDLSTTASDIICMDADNDGRMEFIFGGLDGFLYILNGETDAETRIAAQFNLNAQVGSPIVADLNDDGVAEVLVTTYDGILHCLQSTSSSIANRQTTLGEFRLWQNYPNPFNSITTIQFGLPKNDFVTLRIYNVQGQCVRTLVDERLPAGKHKFDWDGRNSGDRPLTSGVYFYVLSTTNHFLMRKMALVQ